MSFSSLVVIVPSTSGERACQSWRNDMDWMVCCQRFIDKDGIISCDRARVYNINDSMDDDVEVFMVDFIERLSTLLLIWIKVEKDDVSLVLG